MLHLLFRHHGHPPPFSRPRRPVTLSSPICSFLRRNTTTNNATAQESTTSQSIPQPTTENPPRWTARYPWRRSLSYLITAVKFLAFCHVFASKFLMIGVCEGPSMLPTFPNTTSSILMNHLYSRGRGVKVGDLVTANRPDEMGVMLLKRVIGMPGDYVVVDPIAAGRGEETMMVRVPEGHCWIGGDNLPYSIDSRYYGPIPLGLVRSKVIAQISGGWRWLGQNPFTPVERLE
ncbi:hypothetical protein ABW19_dt0205028 [Dactylella cylindrospora]|nr:hypothetical protein ABW19_dt0205028 [Dactylella cylindrospora]